MNQNKFFRANVGVIIINGRGQVLAFERKKHKGSWQLPQGGIDKNESLREAAEREVREETGIHIEKDLRYLAEYNQWTIYELPEEMRSPKIGRGQVQRWFLYQVKNDDLKIDLEKAKDDEFSAWQWMTMEKLVEIVIGFRKPVYVQLLNWLINRKDTF